VTVAGVGAGAGSDAAAGAGAGSDAAAGAGAGSDAAAGADADAGTAAGAGAERGLLTGLGWPLKAFAVAAGIAAVLFAVLTPLLGIGDDTVPFTVLGYAGDGIGGGRARWDAFWYSLIASDGYSTTTYDIHGTGYSSPAFFPGYPMAMRLILPVVRDPLLAGILVNLVAGAVGVCAFYRWVRDRRSAAIARVAVIALLVFPYTFYFYGVVYSEPLFFAAAVGAFVLLERDRVLLAGLAGALACGTRLVGIAVAIALVLRLLERRGVIAEGQRLGFSLRAAPGAEPWRARFGRLHPGDVGVLLPVTGLLAYVVYLGVTFGQPLLFQSSGAAWGQGEGLRTVAKVRTFDFFVESLPYLKIELVIQLALLIGALALAGPVARRFGRAYGWYVVLVLGIPLLTVGNLFGAGRYVIAAFPVFALVGERLRVRPAVARRLAVACVGFTTISIAFYTRGLWIS
jgi:hypothetical protein